MANYNKEFFHIKYLDLYSYTSNLSGIYFDWSIFHLIFRYTQNSRWYLRVLCNDQKSILTPSSLVDTKSWSMTRDNIVHDFDSVVEEFGNACYHHDENENVQYVLEFISMLVIGSIGMIGNTVAIIIFSRMKQQLKFHRLMITLFLFDNLFITLSFVILSFPHVSDGYKYGDIYCRMLPIITPLQYIALTGSIYCTMAISVERYLVVCHPFLTLSRRWSSKLYILPIIAFSILYNIPRFFELKVEKVAGGNVRAEDPSLKNKPASGPMYSIEYTKLRVDFYYESIYRGWINLFLTAIVPFAVLITLNVLIWRTLKTLLSTRNRQSVVGTFGSPGSLMAQSSYQPNEEPTCIPVPVSPRLVTRDNEIMLAKVSVVIVIFFIICHSVRWIPIVYGIVYNHYITDDNFNLPQWIEICKNVSGFLTVMNSSVNFYIYAITHFQVERNLSLRIGFDNCYLCKDSQPYERGADSCTAIPLVHRNGSRPMTP